MQFYPFRKSLDSIGNLVYSVIFSLTVWSFLLLILRFFPFKVNREIAYIFFIVGWLLFLIKSKPWKLSQFKLFFSKKLLIKLVFLITLLITIFVGIYSIKEIVVGLGSDSYHHTLITQLILDKGKIPDNYLPYAPIVSFTYHFGFHSLAAAFSWLSGIPPRLNNSDFGVVLSRIFSIIILCLCP